MTSDDLRLRFLRERVLTATPAQRVVMLYDRLVLDLNRAAADPSAPEHVDHAMQVLAELRASVDENIGPGENLAAIYGYALRELIAVRGGDAAKLAGVLEIVETLRTAWATIAQQPVAVDGQPVAAAAGAWVG